MAGTIYWLWLALKEGLDLAAKHRLLAGFGGPEHLFALSREETARLTDLNAAQAAALADHALDRARAVADDCARRSIRILTLDDAAYPARLRQIADAPLVLYVRGTLPDLDRAPGVGIVGTRKSTPYGLAQAERFGAGLAAAGFTVISGMALGGDAAAMKGAMRAGGQTVAVLGCGVDICYPSAHQRLMGDILLSGAVISEYPPGTEPAGFRFPIRNRIISGLSAAVLVTEAPLRSGALITASRALEQGREVFAIPGSLDSPESAGCNRLIRDGEAMLATCPQDIARELTGVLPQKPDEARVRAVFERETGEAGKPADSPVSLWDQILAREARGEQRKKEREAASADAPKTLPENMDPDERRVAQAVLDGARTPDALIEATGMSAARVMSLVTLLELDGVLGRENGQITVL